MQREHRMVCAGMAGANATIVLAIAICLMPPAAAFGAGVADRLVAEMTDPTVSWEDRCSAEDSLKDLPAEDVLPPLAPHNQKGMPSHGIYNSGGRDHDKNAPVDWQIYYAVARSWGHQLVALPRESAIKVLLPLFESSESHHGRLGILRYLAQRGVPDFEETFADLLDATGEHRSIRAAAALGLMLHGSIDYQDRVIEYARTEDSEDSRDWLNVLIDPRTKRRTGVDPRVVHLAFDSLHREIERSPNSVHGAYFFATKIGNYIGVDFKPDQEAPQYQGENGLTESFFADTVDSAVAWWSENRARIESEILSIESTALRTLIQSPPTEQQR